MEPADHRVHPLDPGQPPRIAHDVCNAGASTPRQNRQSLVPNVHYQRLIVQDKRVRLPSAVAKGLVYREPLFELRGAANLSCDELGTVKEEGGRPLLDDLETSSHQRRADVWPAPDSGGRCPLRRRPGLLR